MDISTESVVATLLESRDGDKLIASARQLLRDDSVQFALNTLWVQYARSEVDVLKSSREDRYEVAELIRNKRLALDDLLDELDGLANTNLSSENED